MAEFKVEHIKRHILIPMVIGISFLFGIFVFLIFWSYIHETEKDVAYDVRMMASIFPKEIEKEGDILQAALNGIVYNEKTRALLKAKDKFGLLEYLKPVFQHLKAELQITHFYLCDTKRVTILRLHQPDVSGDKIERITMLRAEKSGGFSSGLELGPLGTLTVRGVLPCWEGSELIGYIELGKEIGHIIPRLQGILNTPLYILVDKQFIDKKGWEKGINILGRKNSWEEMNKFILIYGIPDSLPKKVIELLSQKSNLKVPGRFNLSFKERKYEATFMPLQDADNRNIGKILLLSDITYISGLTEKIITIFSVVFFVINGCLFLLFYAFLKKVQRQLLDNRDKLIKEARLKEELQKNYLKELEKSYGELEAKVQERTADLMSANELLQQGIAQRKQAQERQGAIADGLNIVVSLMDELISCADIDTLYKKAVELGRDKLGLERCAIFIEDGEYIQGTYGTGRHGQTVDEHAQRFPKNELWEKRLKLLSSRQNHWIVIKEDQFEWDGQKIVPISHGWVAIARISSTQKPIGFFVNDTALSHKILEPIKQDIVVVFCSLLGAVIDRKLAEKELLDSEMKFKALAEKSMVGIYIIQEGIFKYINPKLSEILGYESSDSIINKKVKDFAFSEDWPIVEENINKRLQGEVKSANYTFRIVTRDSGIRFAEVYGTRTEYNGRAAIIGTLLDITERKKAEDKLESALDNWQDTFKAIPDGVWLLDDQCRIIKSNGKLESLLGLTTEEILGQHCHKIFSCGQDFMESCPLKRVNENKFHEDLEFKKEDIGLWFHVTVDIIRDKSGKVKGAVHIVRDVTQRKKTEEELGVLNNELVKSNEKFRRLTLIDSHTGLFNHRYLEEAIEAEFLRAKRSGYPLSVIMLDIDYFKSINDVYGHPFGDLVLRQLAKLIKKTVRRYDIVVRFGGEEFIVLSPGANRQATLILTQRILATSNAFYFGDKEHAVKLKISMAVASYPEDIIAKPMDLIEVADTILNKAKEYGGNRVFSSLDTREIKLSVLGKDEDSNDVKLLKKKIERLSKRANQSLIEAVFAFAKTIEAKDRSTGEHTENTVSYAADIAYELNLPKEDIDRIKQASILHDLGKIGISEKILLKTGSLTKEEFEEVRRHPQIGADIIRPIHFLNSIIPFMLYHHERWDGKGYPSGLKEEEIPVGARILAVADVYEALISERPYRKAYSKTEAIKIMKDGSGAQFDPKIVGIFLDILKKEKTA